MADANLSVFDISTSSGAQKNSLKNYAKILGILVFGLAVLVTVETVMSLSSMFTVAGLLLIGGWIFYRTQRAKRNLNTILNRLAADNNWSLDRPVPDEAFKAGPTVNIMVDPSNRLAGSLSGLPFWLCVNEQNTYLMIDAKKSLPRAIFVSSVYDSGPMKIVFNQFLKAENLVPIKLEGDFDRFFRLYGEPTAAIDVLSIVAPDFMASLIDTGLVQSVMFADHFCFIKSYAADQKHLKGLMVSGQALAKELSD